MIAGKRTYLLIITMFLFGVLGTCLIPAAQASLPTHFLPADHHGIHAPNVVRQRHRQQRVTWHQH